MLRMRHGQTDRAASDRRLRCRAISSIIFTCRNARPSPLPSMTAALVDRARNETGAELLIEDSRTVGLLGARTDSGGDNDGTCNSRFERPSDIERRAGR